MNNKPVFCAAALVVLSLALVQTGCKGCGGEPVAPPKPAPAPEPAAAPAPAPEPAAAAAPAPAPEPKPYLGPQSRSRKGFKLTSGFADGKGKAVSQPTALEANTFYVTALAPDNRPLGGLDKFAGADVHAFLVARDMRQALYAKADAPVAEGADARGVVFTPREGGEHALMIVVAPTGMGEVHTISTPVVIKGALPELMGPGVAKLTSRSRTKGGDVELRSDKPPVAGEAVTLSAVDLDNTGKDKGAVKLPFAVIYNEEMGFGDVLVFDDKGQTSWRPPEAGRYLVLAPPEEGVGALTFKLEVTAPIKGAPAAPSAPPAAPTAAPAAAPPAAPAAAPSPAP